jgi:hypothetical protein
MEVREHVPPLQQPAPTFLTSAYELDPQLPLTFRLPLVEGLEAYFHLPLGELPPAEACVKANRVELAQVPIRTISDLEAIHKHFLVLGRTNQPSDPRFVECKVESCFYRVRQKHGTRIRLAHVRHVHRSIINAVVAFRIAQGDPAYDETSLI